MKKKILILAMGAIFIAILASGTVAFFTADDQAHNIITTGAVDISIEEWQATADGLVPYPQDKPIHVMPATTVSKIVTVRNTDADAYIRAKYEIIVMDADGKVMQISPEKLDSVITISVNGSEWQRKDGDSEWWYYTEEVAAGDATEPLFTSIVFDGPNMTNEYQNCTVEIVVKAQAVQTANNGDDAFEAAGWPKE